MVEYKTYDTAELLGLARLKELLPLVTTDEDALARVELIEKSAAAALQNLDAAIAARAVELKELNATHGRSMRAREKACEDREAALVQKSTALDMRARQIEEARAYAARLKHELEVKHRSLGHVPLAEPMHQFDVMLPPDKGLPAKGKKSTPDIFA